MDTGRLVRKDKADEGGLSGKRGTSRSVHKSIQLQKLRGLWKLGMHCQTLPPGTLVDITMPHPTPRIGNLCF